MPRRDLLQCMSKPPHAAPERKQNQRGIGRQSMNLRERRQREINVGAFADDVLHNVTQLDVRARQGEMLQQCSTARVAGGVERMPEPRNRPPLREPVAHGLVRPQPLD